MPGIGKKVLLDGRELHPNPKVPATVWEVWDALPHLVVPQRGARPVKQLVQLAHALSSDGIKPTAIASVEGQFNGVFDQLGARYDGRLRSAEIEVRTVRGMTISETRHHQAEIRQLRRARRRPRSPSRSRMRSAHSAPTWHSRTSTTSLAPTMTTRTETAPRVAYVKAAALAVVPTVATRSTSRPRKLSTNGSTTRESRCLGCRTNADAYDEIRALAVSPQRTALRRPRVRLEDFADETGYQIALAELVGKHLMSDVDGLFPLTSLNEWEKTVVRKETAPSRLRRVVSQPIRVGCRFPRDYLPDMVGNWRALHPDFIFFNLVNGQVRPSIVDPHGHHLDDAWSS